MTAAAQAVPPGALPELAWAAGAPLARQVAPHLPPLSLADLSRCAKRRRHDVASLASCGNLAVPGAASLSLTARLGRHSNYTHHYHHWLLGDLHRLAARRRLPPPTCLLLTLRDPATRLESGWRFQLLHHGRLRRVWLRGQCVTPDLHPSPALAFMVARFRNGSDPCLGTFYTQSAGHPRWGRASLGGHGEGPIDGDNFLVSQLHFWRGLNCSDERMPEVHVLCAERYEDDWRAVLRRFGRNDSALTEATKHARGGDGRPQAKLLSTLSEADREYVRHALYPWDTALHRHFCGAPREV